MKVTAKTNTNSYQLLQHLLYNSLKSIEPHCGPTDVDTMEVREKTYFASLSPWNSTLKKLSFMLSSIHPEVSLIFVQLVTILDPSYKAAHYARWG